LRDDLRRINGRQCPEEIGPEPERQGRDHIIRCRLRVTLPPENVSLAE
jgi:hypothetical protein